MKPQYENWIESVGKMHDAILEIANREFEVLKTEYCFYSIDFLDFSINLKYEEAFGTRIPIKESIKGIKNDIRQNNELECAPLAFAAKILANNIENLRDNESIDVSNPYALDQWRKSMEAANQIQKLAVELEDAARTEVQVYQVIFAGVENVTRDVIQFIHTLNAYPKSVDKYELYGAACKLIERYSIVADDSRRKSLQTSYGEFVMSCDFGLIGVHEERGRKIRKHNSLFQYWDEVLNCTEIKEAVKCAILIFNTNILPGETRCSDAAYRISSYFKNGRADNLKEAINLYYYEKKLEDQEKKKNQENEKLKEEIVDLVNQVSESINRDYQRRNEQNEQVLHAISSIVAQQEKEYNKLVDKHNRLVDKHNKLVDEVKKAVN